MENNNICEGDRRVIIKWTLALDPSEYSGVIVSPPALLIVYIIQFSSSVCAEDVWLVLEVDIGGWLSIFYQFGSTCNGSSFCPTNHPLGLVLPSLFAHSLYIRKHTSNPFIMPTPRSYIHVFYFVPSVWRSLLQHRRDLFCILPHNISSTYKHSPYFDFSFISIPFNHLFTFFYIYFFKLQFNCLCRRYFNLK